MGLLIAVVLGLLAVAGATALAPKLRLAAPLLLVIAGIAVSLIPAVPNLEVEPEWILAGILPPLLYSASVSMPAMEFRREFGAIGGLSVVLVVASSLILGLFFSLVIPGIGIGWGIALGAIVSPTDAVATSIVKKLGVSSRVVAMLEGEGLLNDATALVLLRAAIAGAAVASVSIWGVIGSFGYSVVIAVVLGLVVGWANLKVRARVQDATVNTVLSLTVPFIASIPAEALGASGLVAAVVAGLVTGQGAARVLSPQHRLSDSQIWRAVELILEGAIFLIMGLELSSIIIDVQTDHEGIWLAVAVAAVALVLTVLVRAAYVAPLLYGLKRRSARSARMKPVITEMQDRLADPNAATAADAAAIEYTSTGRERGRRGERSTRGNRGGPGGQDGPIRLSGPGGAGSGPGQWREGRLPTGEQAVRFATRLRRGLADIDFFLAEPLGWKEGAIVVWAGMRGAVTVAAAQTLPPETPSRSLLIFIAFMVAGGSLLIQGGTLAAVVNWIKPAGVDEAALHLERVKVMELLRSTALEAKEEFESGELSAQELASETDVAQPPDDPGAVDDSADDDAEGIEAAAGMGGAEMADADDSTIEAASGSRAVATPASGDGPTAAHSRRLDFRSSKRLTLAVIHAQRQAILDARDDGLYSAATLNSVLAVLDAEQIGLELRGGPTG